jgi:hypothetical protein
MTYLVGGAAFISIAGDLFGSSGKESGSSQSVSALTSNTTGETRERLEISDEAIGKIIQDVLSGADGLAGIFAGEQNAGIFNSSVANQAAGDLAANITGEIAKLRAEKVGTVDRTTSQQEIQQTQSESKNSGGGLLSGIFG